MLRQTPRRLWKSPRNMHLAPEHDSWHEKHEAWVHLKRMSKLAGTGFYIPPAWYNHFRMFPPITKNFNAATTRNPLNAAEPTQLSRQLLENGTQGHNDRQRFSLRSELAKKSRSAASAGNRYLNQFWVKKPIDEMEREYYTLRREAHLPHDEAIKRVLQSHHEKLARQARVHTIQAEEAKLTGKFITMREAMSVLQVLQGVQSASLATHEYAEIASDTRTQYESDPIVTAKVVQKRVLKEKPPVPPATTTDDATAAAKTGDESTTTTTTGAGDAADKAPDAKDSEAAPKVSTESTEAAPSVGPADEDFEIVEAVETTLTEGDSLPKLREAMHDGLSADEVAEGAFWYDGFSPEVTPGVDSK